jgi:hypothetical protein
MSVIFDLAPLTLSLYESQGESGAWRHDGSGADPSKGGPVSSHYLSDVRSLVACTNSLKVTTLDGGRDYVLLDPRWRCGSSMTLPHSTQRTLPASSSSSVTPSEMRRLCVQLWGGLFERG